MDDVYETLPPSGSRDVIPVGDMALVCPIIHRHVASTVDHKFTLFGLPCSQSSAGSRITILPLAPLPQAPGPKLPPFTSTHADIEFIEELGDPGQDLDAHVWKVKINGKQPYYALKMVSPVVLPTLAVVQEPPAN
jgi:hypothetical protein